MLESHASGASVLLSDENGRLTAIGWELDGSQNGDQNASVRVKKINMGKVRDASCSILTVQSSPASSLSYFNSGHLFLSSACGDSLLLRLKLPSPQSSSPVSPSVGAAARNIIARKGKGRALEDEDGGSWSVVEEDESKGRLEVRERWMNLAPVKDFCVVQEEGGGVVCRVQRMALIEVSLGCRVWRIE